MISPHILAELAMLRRAYLPVVAGNKTKRPTGGRPNPCALHREPRHGAAIARETRAAAPAKRRRARLAPAWQRLAEAVARGEVPVGVPIGDSEMKRLLGSDFCHGMEGIAFALAANRAAVRLRQVSPNKWIVAIA